MTVFTRIMDGEALWLEHGVSNLHNSISASDFPCGGDERHEVTIMRAGEEVAWFVQHPDDWTIWTDSEDSEAESIYPEDWQIGDRLIVEVG